MAAMYFYTRLEMCHFQQKWWGGEPNKTQKADFENDPFFVWLQKSQCFKTASIQKSQKNEYKNILSSVKVAVMAVMPLFALILRAFIFLSM